MGSTNEVETSLPKVDTSVYICVCVCVCIKWTSTLTPQNWVHKLAVSYGTLSLIAMFTRTDIMTERILLYMKVS